MQVVHTISDGEVSWKPAALETQNGTKEWNQQES